MAGTHISPTRMQLKREKARLVTATRGHKLLKDKNDELMKQFLEIVRENMKLRIAVEKKVEALHRSFTAASAAMSPEGLDQALMLPRQSVTLEMTAKNIMSVHVPVYSFHTRLAEDGGILPYGFASTPSELDDSVREAGDLLSDLLELAAKEKAASLLAAEIEKTRRRVNALEHVLIPQTKENIKIISMKLAENDRANTTRLMKIKDMVLNQAHNYE